ncbi:4865_t:CDS:2 [Cetraspora pellucida]|uniref:4865_t:CDS:1 n=1 Tax=Cetraspora pellucida TaxID=1433469 RepID=A0A9N9AXE3_9GLOM|nr:4865_t:CDS:2 [Cetraspora pellucida]
MQSIDSLRELNSKLVAEIAELRKENAKLKQIIEENTERDVRVEELEQKNTELEARLAILEQGEKGISTEDVSQSPVNSNDTPKQIVQQCDDTPVSDITDNTLNSNDTHEKSNTSNSDIYQDSVIPIYPTETISFASQSDLRRLDEKEENEFLDSMYKEQVSKEIIQSIREKKLRDQNSDLSLVNQTISSAESEKTVTSTSYESKTVTKCHDQNNALDNTTSEILESDNQIIEGLIQEITYGHEQRIVSEINPLSSINGNNDEVNVSGIQDIVPGSVQSLSDLFDKAIKSADGEIKDKTARSKIYKEMKPFLPNITDANLHKKTERARKILKLFGGRGVGIDKIEYITYSTSTISGLKNTQIQHIIYEVTLKTVPKCHDQINVEEDLPEDKKTSSKKQINRKNNHANFIKKTLEQFPDLYYECSSENFDYYGITSETLCPLCKLDHEGEEGIEDKIRSKLYKRYKNETGLDPWIKSESLQISEASIAKKNVNNYIPQNNSLETQIRIPWINVQPTSSKLRSPISILPKDPEEKQKHVIKMVLERFPYLTLKHSFKKSDNFVFNSFISCPICNKNYKKENIRNFIEGIWGSSEYCGKKAYRLYCYTNKYQNSIHIVSIKA